MYGRGLLSCAFLHMGVAGHEAREELTAQWVFKESGTCRMQHIACVSAAQLINGLAESLAHL